MNIVSLSSRHVLIATLTAVIIGGGDLNEDKEMADLADPFGKSQLSDALRDLLVSFGDNVRLVESPFPHLVVY